jgi:catechol 2,3-dioxygenase-like lactoylglutathione lyase family enzyme
MKVIEIAFVGYPVTDLRRARSFYERTLGLAVSRLFGEDVTGWVEYDLGANTLAIGNVSPDWKPSSGGGSVALEVEDMSAAVSQLKADGYPPFLGPLETPVCYLAVVSDPDGNSITIHQRKPA